MECDFINCQLSQLKKAVEKLLYIIRHGETDHNRNRIVQGRGVDTSLNEVGRKQAQLFYSKYQHHEFDLLLASSQQRAYQTISAFEKNNLKVNQDHRIDEISWGEHEGKSGGEELMKKYDRIIQSWSLGNYDDKPVGGESANELSLRVNSFLEDLCNQSFNCALISTHGRTLKALICLLKNQPLSLMDTIPHHNTGLYLVRWRFDQFEIMRENDCGHLGVNQWFSC